MKITIRAISALIVSVPLVASACWEAVSLQDFVKGKQVIVVGEIQRIDAAPKAKLAYDTAYIKVERVLKWTLPGTPKVGSEIALTAPSPKSETKLSINIYRKVGQRGVWILYQSEGKFTAGHPMSLQPISMEPDVVTAIKADESK